MAQNPTVEDFLKRQGPVITTTRIGITRAAALPLRFYLNGSEYVSKKGLKGAKTLNR
jgi:3-methyladenine DNA glycosylase Mpg